MKRGQASVNNPAEPEEKISDMSVIENKQIAIVGGGPGGLTLARLLQLKGARVKVYERDYSKDVRVQGATLDLHEESGLRALQKAGLIEAFKSNFRPGAEKLRVTNKNAEIIWDDHLNPTSEIARPEIDRAPLRKLLLDSLEPETIIWNSRFIGMALQSDVWKLEFENETSALADLVIAADGANSKIRPYLTSVKPFYAGVTIVEGAVDNSAANSPRVHQLLKGGKIFALGDEKSLIVSSKGDGSLVFYTGCKTGEQWWRESGINFSDKAQVTKWFKIEFAGWDNIWRELFENAALPFIPRPQYCMPPDQTWDALPNLTMLGDAAHLMPPYAGEGVNMAMQDALELSICLMSEDFTNTQAAISAYEKQMRARASEIAKMTLEQTTALHSPNAAAHLISVINQSEI